MLATPRGRARRRSQGEPRALDGGITNRNYRVRARRRGLRRCGCPGKDTELLGIDRAAERARDERGGARWASRPAVAAFAERTCLVTRVRRRRARSTPEARCEPRRAQVARALRAFHDSRRALPARFCGSAICSTTTPRVAERAARAARRLRRGAATLADADRRGAAARPSRVPCHNDLLAGQPDPAPTASACCSSTGSTPGWATATSTSATWRSTTSFDRGDRRARCWRAYFGEPPHRRAAAPRCG